jgi:hypothetical protein
MPAMKEPHRLVLVEAQRRRRTRERANGLEINGVGRDKDCLSALVLYFSRAVTDDEMRFIHDVMKRAADALPNLRAKGRWQAEGRMPDWWRPVKPEKALDAVADKVLTYRPKPKSAPAKRRKRRKAKLAKKPR